MGSGKDHRRLRPKGGRRKQLKYGSVRPVAATGNQKNKNRSQKCRRSSLSLQDPVRPSSRGHGNHRLNCLPGVEIWCMYCSRTCEDREVTVTTVKLRTLHVLSSFVIDSSSLIQTREMLQGLYKCLT